jgi:hypothetical protein
LGQSGHARHPNEVVRDQYKIASLYLKGKPMYQIAEELGLSGPTIGADMKVIQERWMAESTTKLAEAKAIELAKLNNLELEYWSGWERSKEDAVLVVEEESEKGFKSKKQVRGQAGDPRFLDGIRECVKERCKIIGITRDLTINIDLNVLPLEYLERVVAGESEIDVFADWQRAQGLGDAIEAAFLPDSAAGDFAPPDSSLESVKVSNEFVEVGQDESTPSDEDAASPSAPIRWVTLADEDDQFVEVDDEPTLKNVKVDKDDASD